MKINISKKKDKTCFFNSISDGRLFSDDKKRIFMKTNVEQAVNLLTGNIVEFDIDDPVYEVEIID